MRPLKFITLSAMLLMLATAAKAQGFGMFGMNRPQQQQQSEATARQYTLNLTPDGKAQMICYLPKEPNGKAVVGIPGGGYAMLSNSHEGTLASGWMNEHEDQMERVIFNVFKDEDKEYYEQLLFL